VLVYSRRNKIGKAKLVVRARSGSTTLHGLGGPLFEEVLHQDQALLRFWIESSFCAR